MARLASQARMGYYAAHPAAVSAVRERLSRSMNGDCLVLDPCAGAGDALVQLARELGAVPYGVELDAGRGEALGAQVNHTLAPADFLGCRISPRTFSFIWCNPPYDYATGGEGRVEHKFLEAVVPLLVEDGVLALVCPENIASGYKMGDFLDYHFYDISAMPFPAEVRKYKEVVVLGKRRKETNRHFDGYNVWRKAISKRIEYTLPPGRPPAQFIKWELTDPELEECLTSSPLNGILRAPPEGVDLRPRPPMSPGKGHRALLLASGHLDGLICPPDEPPHVIRGVATKETYVAEQTETENEKGDITSRTVFSEKQVLTIRALDHEGTIHTLRQGE